MSAIAAAVLAGGATRAEAQCSRSDGPLTRPAADCAIEITDFRAIPTKDEPIDWGASDGNPNTLPNTARLTDDYDSAHDPNDATYDRPELQAGAHPYLNLFIRFCDPDPTDHVTATQQGCTDDQLNARVRDLQVDLPPGMVGNPLAVPRCPLHLVIVGVLCEDSRIGFTFNYALNGGGNQRQIAATGLYSVETFGMEPARLATGLLPSLNPGPLPVLVSAIQGSDGDVKISSLTPDLPPVWSSGTDALKIVEQQIVLFNKAPVDWIGFGSAAPPSTPVGAKPFMVNPTSCGQKTVKVSATVWEQNAQPAKASAQDSFDASGCSSAATRPKLDRPASDPLGAEQAAVEVKQDLARGGTEQAGVPSAYNVDVHLPDTEHSEIHGSHLKDSKVVLPKGVTLAAGAGTNLEGCTEEQFGLSNPQAPVGCPGASKLGDVEVRSPVVPEELGGGLYFGQPNAPGPATDANPWPLYLAIEGSGVRVKLAGEVTIDQATGQISTEFRNNPQVPFTDLSIQMQGGDRAILQNPTGCGANEGHVQLDGWSGDSVVTTPTVSVTGCSDSPPFAPSVSAHADNPSAGASSPSHLRVDRPDGNSRLRTLSLALPAGLAGSLTRVPLCPAANALAGTCPETSRVGDVETSVGYGSATLDVPGSLYLAEKTAPDEVASLSAVIPAKIGPIDLGQVNVLNHVKLRQSDGGLTAETDEIPTSLGGIPLYVKQIRIDVTRPNFLTNPTGCDPRSLVAGFNSEVGQTASAAVSLTATNCNLLPFKPRLRLIAQGDTGVNGHPALRAIVTQTQGEANISRAVVTLPDILRPELPAIQKSLCRSEQLAANSCPPNSMVGSAVANTPLLPQPLSGPVFMVQDPNPVDPLPRLVVRLGGMASIDLLARNTIQGVRTVNTFEGVPDLPVSRFELAIRGGSLGILKNFRPLCDERSRADATFFGHNGAAPVTRPWLETPGCEAGVSGFSVRSKTVRMTRRGIVKVRVRCGSAACNGRIALETGRASTSRRLGGKRFSGRANRTTTVRIRLKARDRRRVRRRRRKALRVRVVATLGDNTLRTTLKIKKPKRKHKKTRRSRV